MRTIRLGLWAYAYLDSCIIHMLAQTSAEAPVCVCVCACVCVQDARPYKRARPGAGMMGGQHMQQMQMQQMQMQHMQHMPQMQQMQMQHMQQMPQMQQMQMQQMQPPQAQIVHASAVPANMGMQGVVLGISVNPQ